LVTLWAIVIIGIYALVTCAHAAEDEVCRPYATQLLNNNMTWLWWRAFNHCKLLEEDKPKPPQPGNWRGALDILEPDHTPISEIGNVPATEEIPKPPERPAEAITPPPAQAATPARSSAGVAAARAKCKSTHPAGFQANSGTGTFNTLFKGKWVRVPCPG
jgi:hypothetical protein